MENKKEEPEEKTIEILVKPNSREQGIEKFGAGLKVRVKSKPDKGKANSELVDLLSHFFGVYKENIRIVSGMGSRKKIVKVRLYKEY
jgi:uncharacterized protein (TIGR00251 family)